MIKIRSISINYYRVTVAILLGLFVFLSTDLFEHFGSDSDTIELSIDDSQDDTNDNDENEVEKLKYRSQYILFGRTSIFQPEGLQSILSRLINNKYEELDFQILIPPPESRM